MTPNENLGDHYRNLALKAIESLEDLLNGTSCKSDAYLVVYEARIQRYSALAAMEYAREAARPKTLSARPGIGYVEER